MGVAKNREMRGKAPLESHNLKPGMRLAYA
jgi:hypothetical protein